VYQGTASVLRFLRVDAAALAAEAVRGRDFAVEVAWLKSVGDNLLRPPEIITYKGCLVRKLLILRSCSELSPTL
jgi:hypothetical protein